MNMSAWAAICARWFVRWKAVSPWNAWKITCRRRLGKIWSMGILIKNGTVVSAEKTFAADVLIEGATIQEVRPGIALQPGHEVVDATGMLLLPGGIDAHTHLDMPFGGTTSSDDFETGTLAAAIG